MNRRDLFRVAALTFASFLPSFGRTLKFPPSVPTQNTLLTSQIITAKALRLLEREFHFMPMFPADKVGETCQ